jgi:NAD(P)H-hydrate repair Nnr-like enzyme with NAD(P)H-hydrate dehydratase domain
MPTSRPRPLRVAASIVGGLTALVSGLVGSGLLTGGQGDALTGIITAVLALLAAFGITASVEPKVTPLADPHDSAGRALIPSSEAQ